jgi:hypothetical protein
MRNRTSRQAPRAPEWAIAVRLADGSRLFYCICGGRHGQAEWGREAQAHRFATEAEATRVANSFDTNTVAKEYLVIRLRQPLRHER